MFKKTNVLLDKLKTKKIIYTPSSEMMIRFNKKERLKPFKKNWYQFSPTPYIQKNISYRERKFGQFVVSVCRQEIMSVTDSIFFQTLKINSYIKEFNTILPKINTQTSINNLLHNIILPVLNIIVTYKQKAYFLCDAFIHKIRLIANILLNGHTTHKEIQLDRHTIISRHLIERKNIKDDISYIYEHNKNKVYENILLYVKDFCKKKTREFYINIRDDIILTLISYLYKNKMKVSYHD
ncbi:2OG-Fe dioxygenase family protein [Bartonella sp. DGB1]|uniref:2OG-Fe dioxygenase family protein n=1 Tax=Bartonella sp. DGB1 TaxID=3239807 RepID=UPI0035244F69